MPMPGPMSDDVSCIAGDRGFDGKNSNLVVYRGFCCRFEKDDKKALLGLIGFILLQPLSILMYLTLVVSQFGT